MAGGGAHEGQGLDVLGGQGHDVLQRFGPIAPETRGERAAKALFLGWVDRQQAEMPLEFAEVLW
ncbi:hypothetical protein ACWD5Q_04095 [Streptomyces sp. NPDC002513]